MRVVDEQQERLLLRTSREQAQGRGADGEAVLRTRGRERERARESRGLRPRNRIERGERRP
ncbi:MAG: hypothetical protein AUG91_03340 [Actinobacteria bacterium 13_1_20CM_4_69_9]|nr:MAG: hypothetical protein AUG91_03340 [Actinobacteria bacterium 13_1_20CM_4_69_9]